MDEQVQELKERAEEFLEAARLLANVELWNAAFDDARQAAELASKGLLLMHHGSYPRKHQVAGELNDAGLIPPSVTAKQVSRVLGAWTLGRYGFADRIERHNSMKGFRLPRHWSRAYTVERH